MSDFDDAIGDMVTDLLTEAGGSVTYRRGTTSTVLTMRRSQMPSEYIDNGQGGITEYRPTDFIGLTSDLPYDPPLQGDKIVSGGLTYEVQPTVGESVYRRISTQMTRIHTKKVAG